MTSICVIKGALAGKQIELARGIATIGRDQTNSIQVADPEISRCHAELHFRGDEYWIVDLKSSNGTFVNDKRIDSVKLQSGDQIRVGRTTFVFESQTEEECSSSSFGPIFDLMPTTPIPDDNLKQIESDETVPSEVAEWIARAKSNIHVMYQTALVTSYHEDIDALFQRMLDLVVTWIAADRACVLLACDDKKGFQPTAFRQISGDEVNQQRFEINQAVVDYVVEHNEGMLTHNVSTDQRLADSAEIPATDEVEAICVPIRGRSGICGLIYVERPAAKLSDDDSHDPGFNEDQLKLLVAIGHQAAVAIENVDHYESRLESERSAVIGKVMESLSHHIKNILQSINGGTHLIEDGLKKHNYELVQNGWEIVQRNQESMSHLVMDMFSYSRNREPKLASCDLNELVKKSLKSLKRQAAYFGVNVEFAPCRGLDELQLDSEMLHTAIYNVLLTSIFACHDNSGGTVTVDIRKLNDKAVQILVADNGVGFSEKDLDTIFDPLVINEYSSRTGLRMAVSKKILLEHGGDIGVERNIADGQGTVFTLTLPIVRFNNGNGGNATVVLN